MEREGAQENAKKSELNLYSPTHLALISSLSLIEMLAYLSLINSQLR